MKRQVILHIEGVPNPNAMKFVLENGILTDKPYEFNSLGEAKDSPLARRILMLRYVNRVMLNHNYITVVKDPKQLEDWNEVLLEVKLLIEQHLGNDEPIMYMGVQGLEHPQNDDVVLKLVEQLLDKHIRPAAQEDGGDILVDSFKDGVVNLSMHGACHKCPFAKDTLKKGVEPLLTNMIAEVRSVVALENDVFK